MGQIRLIAASRSWEEPESSMVMWDFVVATAPESEPTSPIHDPATVIAWMPRSDVTLGDLHAPGTY
ncbi:MAG: hypothetical protein ACRDTG_13910 [Pseudonocardiaceae bacterium]